MVFNQCCCCVDLRTGAIVIAVLDILNGFGNFSQGATGIVSGIALLVAGALPLYGAIKYHQMAVLVYLILEVIGIILLLIMAILVFVAGAQYGDIGAVAIIGVVIFIVAALHFYFWLCVYSFYKGLKSGSITSPEA